MSYPKMNGSISEQPLPSYIMSDDDLWDFLSNAHMTCKSPNCAVINCEQCEDIINYLKGLV